MIGSGSRRSRTLLVGAFAMLAVSHAAAAAETIAFTPDRWDLENAFASTHLGRSALSGTAWLKDTVFENGIVEVDVAMERQRSYPAIIFRRQAEGDYEHIYLRPHRAGLYADALQYAPSFNGVVAWQLYSGPGHTAGVTLPEKEWVHLRLEAKGSQARVFISGSSDPALEIDRLERGESRSGLGLQSPPNGPAAFSNFSYSATDDLRFVPPPAADPVPGAIVDWTLSPVRPASALAPERYLDGQSAGDVS